MIGLHSSIGRAVIVVAAAITIIGFTVAGYSVARANEFMTYGTFSLSGGVLTRLEVLFSVLGCVVGFIVAGAVFGAIATLYEIRDSLRILTGRETTNRTGDGDRPPAARMRREPHIG
jgi:TRAP-type C4-dicarboxylate transport system permease small subunit